MSDYTLKRPDTGSLGTYRALSAEWSAESDRVQTALDSLNSIIAAVDETAWSGGGADDWRARAPRSLAELAAIKKAFVDAYGAIDDHVSTLQPIFDDAPDQRSVRTQRFRSFPCIDSADYNWGYRSHHWACMEVPAEESAEHNVKADTAAIEINEAEMALRLWQLTRDGAVSSLREALAKVYPKGWTTTYAALQAAGVTSVSDIDADTIAKTIAGLTDGIYDGVSAEEAAALEKILGQYSDNKDVMDALFNKMGGTRTAAFIDMAGSLTANDGAPVAALLAIAASMRAGLSLSSASWSKSKAKEFADELMDSYAFAAIGYLFSKAETNPMGENLAVEMANRVDYLERHDPNWEHGYEVAQSGGSKLGALEFGMGSRNTDFASRILQTLGQYPDAALDWLTDGSAEDGTTLGQARIEYWYGERASGLSGDRAVAFPTDGFEGVMALWNGAVQADGGLVSGAFDPKVNLKIAELNSQVMSALGGNESANSGELSEAAKLYLSNVLGSQMDVLQETIRTPSERSGLSRLEWVVVGDPPQFAQVEVPNVGLQDLTRVLGLLAGSDGAKSVLDDSITSVLSMRLEASTSAGYQEAIAAGLDLKLENTVEHAFTLQGAVDGAIYGSDLDAAVRTQEAREGMQEVASNIWGIGTSFVPGASALFKTAGPGASLVIDGFSGIGLDALGDAITGGNPEEIRAAVTAIEQQMVQEGTAIDVQARGAMRMLDMVGSGVSDRELMFNPKYSDETFDYNLQGQDFPARTLDAADAYAKGVSQYLLPSALDAAGR